MGGGARRSGSHIRSEGAEGGGGDETEGGGMKSGRGEGGCEEERGKSEGREDIREGGEGGGREEDKNYMTTIGMSPEAVPYHMHVSCTQNVSHLVREGLFTNLSR